MPPAALLRRPLIYPITALINTYKCLKAIPAQHGTRTGTFIVVSFEERLILIGGRPMRGRLRNRPLPC